MTADRLTVGLCAAGGARTLLVDATETIQAFGTAHGLSGRALRFGAQLCVSNLLMSAHVKGQERVSLQLQTDWPKVSFLGEADAVGAFRGRFSPEHLAPGDDQLTGVLFAIKSDAQRELYRGATPVEGESIEGALTRHLAQSAQTFDVVRLFVEVDGSTVRAAVGLLVERLPGDAETADALMAIISVATEAEVAEAVRDRAILGTPVEVLDERPVVWSCRCSPEKVESTLLSLGVDMLREILDEDGRADVGCDWCNSTYVLDRPHLSELVARLQPQADG